MSPNDHDIVIIDTFLHMTPNKKMKRKIQLWSKADWNDLRSKALDFQNEYLQNTTDSVEQCYPKFTTFIEKLIEEHVPWKYSSNRNRVPWMTASIRRLCRKKQRAYNKARKSRSPSDWKHFRSIQKNVINSLKRARENYINNIIAEGLEKNDSKPFWRYIKSQRQDNCGVAPLKSKTSNDLISDNSSKAKILNSQFCSVFTSDQNDPNSDTVLEGPSIPSIGDIVFMVPGIEKLLRNLNPKKAGGPDNVGCRILKELACELAPVLTHIFQISYDKGELPACWKNANVAPIYKKGPVYDPANYRPVSLTCITCKLMEHVIAHHMREHLDCHKVLTPLQHGFRSLFSCETQLLLTIQDLIERRDPVKSQIDIGVLDFSKAFDVVPHNRLLSKLRLMGIDGKCARWVKSFLSDRSQQVVVDGAVSQSAPVISGVPQGTIMGPLLFLCFINDITTVVDPGTQMRLFADDCLIYRNIYSINDQIQLQKDLDALFNWGMQWGMRFNPSKCNILSSFNCSTPLVKFYQINNTIIHHVEKTKYLGILIHKSLEFDHHIQNMVSRANGKLGFLKRNLRGCPSALKRSAYVGLVRSGLEYGAVIWDPHNDNQKKAIELVQNKAMRWIKDLPPYDRSHIEDLLRDTGLRSLEQRRRDARLTMLYKMVHGLVALTPEELGLVQTNRRPRAGEAHHTRFKHRPARVDLRLYSFVNRTVPAWNRLPADTAEAESLETFKARLAPARLP